jgi:hypothetical protein
MRVSQALTAQLLLVLHNTALDSCGVHIPLASYHCVLCAHSILLTCIVLFYFAAYTLHTHVYTHCSPISPQSAMAATAAEKLAQLRQTKEALRAQVASSMAASAAR